MNYSYPPLYKYIIFILIFFMFMKYYRAITQQYYLFVAVFATLLMIFLDYLLIENHPNLVYTGTDENDVEIALNELIEVETNDSDDYNNSDDSDDLDNSYNSDKLDDFDESDNDN